MLTRRQFTQRSALALGALLTTHCTPSTPETVDTIMTVNGPIPSSELGMTLSHEHTLVDFVEASEIGPGRYDADEVFDVVLPYLQEVHQQGFRAFFDFTPDYLGRDPVILQRLSNATGLHIVTNTGYYGARNDVHLPPHVQTESVDELARRWILEWEEGIGTSGIRPGFMKIGVDAGPLSETDARLVRAAARAHRATGMTIAVHTGPAEGAFDQLTVLDEEGVHPSAWVWVHAQNEEDMSRHVAAAREGAWVAFDGVRPNSLERHVKQVLHMKNIDLLEHVLISQDAGWYSVGEERGGAFRGYTFLYDEFLPALREEGLTEADIDQLLVTNPARAFTVRTRLRQ